ncbi:MAG: hypothetical protein JSS20_05290, partial [Proteobacteria bacterium]|nr:hypothetical protein [Pseudomonadota bacterium]
MGAFATRGMLAAAATLAALAAPAGMATAAEKWRDIGRFGTTRLETPPPCFLERQRNKAVECGLPAKQGADPEFRARIRWERVIGLLWEMRQSEAREEVDRAIVDAPTDIQWLHLRARLAIDDGWGRG